MRGRTCPALFKTSGNHHHKCSSPCSLQRRALALLNSPKNNFFAGLKPYATLKKNGKMRIAGFKLEI